MPRYGAVYAAKVWRGVKRGSPPRACNSKAALGRLIGRDEQSGQRHEQAPDHRISKLGPFFMVRNVIE